MKNKKIAIFIVMILVFVFAASGCQPRQLQKPNVKNERMENRIVGDQRRNNYLYRDRMNTNLNNDFSGNMTKNGRNVNLTDRANRIAKKVASLSEVNSASCVITGNTALIGINMKNTMEGKMTNSLKKKVEKVVRNTDKNITNVSVTADADLYTRISNMSRDMRNGKPLSGFTNEIQEILRRISPSK